MTIHCVKCGETLQEGFAYRAEYKKMELLRDSFVIERTDPKVVAIWYCVKCTPQMVKEDNA